MADFVLVHGAWHGGWCYDKVARRLRDLGHTVFTPTLTGLGERSHLLHEGIDLDTHIQDVVNVILWEDLTDVILCGHSYGGIVVTGVADRLADRLAIVVYLDAFLPEDGDSTFDFLEEERRARMLVDTAAHDGISVPAPPPEMYGVNADDIEWVRGKLTSHPLASMQQPIRLTGAYKSLPRIFVYAKGEEVSAPFYKACLDDPAWTVFVTEIGGHDQMVDDPDAVTEILVNAVP